MKKEKIKKTLTMGEIDNIDWELLYEYENDEHTEKRCFLHALTEEPYFAVVEAKNGKLLLFNIFYGDLMIQDWFEREDYLLEKEYYTEMHCRMPYLQKALKKCLQAMEKAQEIVNRKVGK